MGFTSCLLGLQLPSWAGRPLQSPQILAQDHAGFTGTGDAGHAQVPLDLGHDRVDVLLVSQVTIPIPQVVVGGTGVPVGLCGVSSPGSPLCCGSGPLLPVRGPSEWAGGHLGSPGCPQHSGHGGAGPPFLAIPLLSQRGEQRGLRGRDLLVQPPQMLKQGGGRGWMPCSSIGGQALHWSSYKACCVGAPGSCRCPPGVYHGPDSHPRCSPCPPGSCHPRAAGVVGDALLLLGEAFIIVFLLRGIVHLELESPSGLWFWHSYSLGMGLWL